MRRNLTPDLPGNTSPGGPVRPPRPPTGDSPARIESKYFADIDDSGFYCYPNPIVLEPTTPVINSPPPVVTTGVQIQPSFLPPRHQSFTPIPLGVDVIQRHIRSYSTPSFDSPSIRNSGSTLETLEPSPGADSDRTLISTSHRKSTSAVSWIRYSEFQQQHHLRLQQQRIFDDVCTCGSDTSPFGDQREIGAAY
ncbi:hypothetical protein P691DRAFT_670842 [Macrolepiota fuliginosa MF-IS2]|uniref:Uncharacterized protein n=1 Tax=Macrolepiota fuliginosa MF-IS2 TaxID=1400762 RepID=A0A9P6C1G8_9AGAR|nr:hypothetical protein P691DRAFT_670842 [Macrolepiota fuliginosa MF-IS2]